MRRLTFAVATLALLVGATAAPASIVPTLAPLVFYNLNPDGSGQSIQTGGAPNGTFFVARSSMGQLAVSPL